MRLTVLMKLWSVTVKLFHKQRFDTNSAFYNKFCFGINFYFVTTEPPTPLINKQVIQSDAFTTWRKIRVII